MFLDFYKMREQPFGVTPDPRFLYLGKSHREALASLYYGIASDRGFVSLIAPPGLGKTTLAFQLLEKLQQASRTVFLCQTKCNSREFFQYLLNGLGVNTEGMGLVSMSSKLNQILSREMLVGRRFVLAVDEAQNLDPEVLEAVRLLSNFETSRHKMLQILLVGQPQLARKLASPELEQLHQRISAFARIEPLGFEETGRYIAHRLQVAGYDGSSLFGPGALRLIAEHSQGIPRKINALCFSALSLSFAMGRKQVDVGMMEEAVADRDVEALPAPKPPLGVARSLAAASSALNSPLTTGASLASYTAKPNNSFYRWTLGAAGLAACVAIGIGILTFSPGRSEVWSSVRSAVASIKTLWGVKTDSAPLAPGLNVQAAELPNPIPNPEAKQSSPSGDQPEIKTVIVQPGDTLRQIMLRTVGEFDGHTIGRVRKLNPGMTDIDRIEVGQPIRVPSLSMHVDSPTAREAASVAGKH